MNTDEGAGCLTSAYSQRVSHVFHSYPCPSVVSLSSTAGIHRKLRWFGPLLACVQSRILCYITRKLLHEVVWYHVASRSPAIGRASRRWGCAIRHAIQLS